jgi:hypothetical protein
MEKATAWGSERPMGPASASSSAKSDIHRSSRRRWRSQNLKRKIGSSRTADKIHHRNRRHSRSRL